MCMCVFACVCARARVNEYVFNVLVCGQCGVCMGLWCGVFVLMSVLCTVCFINVCMWL